MGENRVLAYKWLALLTVSIGSFMATLDNSIINISFPRLVSVFETEPSVVLWVTVAYLLASTGLMLIIGMTGDIFGRKRVYVLGVVLFSIGLILCSLSQSILQLILARVLQGMGAAMIMGLSPAIITAAFPDQERGKALGIMGAILSAGVLVGPVLGGLLLDTLGWRAIFYTRIPVGIISLAMAWTLLKEPRGSNFNSKLDLWGATTIFSGVVCLILFFNLGGRLGFVSPAVLVLGTSAAILLTLFGIQERKAEQPVVELALFKHRLFSGGITSLGIMGFALSTWVFLMPFYLIDGVGYSALESGVLLAVTSLIMLVIAPLSGWLSDKIGPRLLCTGGITLMSLALFLFSRLNIESSSTHIALALAVLGIGMGAFQSPNSSSIMGAVPKDRLGTASAMMSTIRQTGISAGMAIAGVIFTSRQLFYATQLSHDDPLWLQRLSIIGGFRDTMLIAAIACGIGILTSLARGKQETKSYLK